MEFKFDSRKATQAAAILLSRERKMMDRMRLLKLLYLVDRELLADSGRTLTGDRAVAMNFGPVPSHIYNLIKGCEHSPEDWDQNILSVGKKVVLLDDPGRGDLSENEMAKLEAVSERYRKMSTAGLSAHTHQFSEWIKNFVPDTSRPIPWTDALKGMNQEGKIELYEARQKEQDLLDSIFTVPVRDEVEAGTGT